MMTKYYPRHTFDTIVDTFGLCSFDDPISVLKELQRVCKPNGKILLLEHGRSKTWNGLSNYLDKNAERHAKNWGCVWNRDLDDILEQSGLVVEQLDTWHFGTTYYVVCRPGDAFGEDEEEKEEGGDEGEDGHGNGNGTIADGSKKEKRSIWSRIWRR